MSRIIGQQKALDYLKSNLKSGNIASAYLFHGIEGIGKTMAAIEFAKMTNCGHSPEACGTCISCKKIESMNHPDVIVIAPEEEGGAITIEQVRDMEQRISFRIYEGHHRFIIMMGADAMTVHAQNALLKTLEEPPLNSHFILTCHEILALRPTILSRCRKVAFSPLTKEEFADYFTSIDPIKSDTNVDNLFSLSQGSISSAKRLLDKDLQSWPPKLIQQLLDMKKLDVIATAQEFHDAIDEAPLILDLWAILFHDIACVQSGQPNMITMTQYFDDIQKLSTQMDADTLFEWMEAIEQCQQDLKKNVNGLLVFENLLFIMQESLN